MTALVKQKEKLGLLESGCRALAEAVSIDVVLDILKNARAAEVYFTKERDYGSAAQQDAGELRLRAERRLGELIEARVRQGRPGKRSHDVTISDRRLPEGVTKMQAHRYKKVASVDESNFEQYIADCRQKGEAITTEGAKRLAKKQVREQKLKTIAGQSEACTVDDLAKLVKARQTFGTLYADPPWQYGNQGTRASTDNHYPTMTVEEICALPVGKLAAEESHLHLWTTNAFLFECPKIFEAWGFEYKSVFVWVKPQMGMGNYWRVSHEFLVLGVRGDKPFADRGLMSWAAIDRGEHSAKPESVRRMVEKASPGPRLELFGRQPADGWTVWGNQITKGMFDTDVTEL
jgi:N6-adenosine-specific RNA methylase IME4